MPRAAIINEFGLTQKQESFCQSFLETGNATEAYRRHYDVSNMKPESVNRAAFEILRNAKIQSRLESLRKPIREFSQLTLEQHLSDLQRLRDKAENYRQMQAAIKAEEVRGKAAGLHVEKREISGPGGSAIPLRIIVNYGDVEVNEEEDVD